MACRQPAVITFPPPQFNAAYLDRRMLEHREWRDHETARLVAEGVSEVCGAIGAVQKIRSHSLVERIEEETFRNAIAKSEPDPILAPDAGDFFKAKLLDHPETCGFEDCENETRCGAESRDSVFSPYCSAHMHVVFADWMVGV